MAEKPITYKTVVARLTDAVPEFRPFVAEHLQDNDGELLPHVLFGDLTRFYAGAKERGDHDLARRCLLFLEKAIISSDRAVEELVAVSFVENLAPWEGREDLSHWPPRLRDEYERQRDWTP